MTDVFGDNCLLQCTLERFQSRSNILFRFTSTILFAAVVPALEKRLQNCTVSLESNGYKFWSMHGPVIYCEVLIHILSFLGRNYYKVYYLILSLIHI